jgi:hypothetical protein
MKTISRIALLGVALAAAAPVTADAGIFGRSGRSTASQSTRRSFGQRFMSFVQRPFRRTVVTGSLRPGASSEIADFTSSMENTVMGNATPPFHLVNMSQGARLRQTRGSNYKQNITARWSVSRLGAAGKLSMTALLPVSGHTGEAAEFARTNVYEVEIEYADGTTVTKVVKSTGLVTELPLELELKPGTNFVRFAAKGSAGVGGFQSGREIELVWDGN